MKEFLGSDAILAVHFADPKTAQCQGDEEMARLEFAADRASRERGVIKTSGCSYFDASTRRVGGWAAATAKRRRNNGLRVFMLMSPFDVSSNEIDTRR